MKMLKPNKTFDENGLWDESIEEFIDKECDGTIAWELLEDEEEDW